MVGFFECTEDECKVLVSFVERDPNAKWMEMSIFVRCSTRKDWIAFIGQLVRCIGEKMIVLK